MNYYPHHLGDYAKDTGHLSMSEHGAYRLLLDRYYGTEQPIQRADVYRITKACTKAERAAADTVVREFFTEKDGALYQNRVEREISIMEKARQRAREHGSKGGRPKTQRVPENNPAGLYENPAGCRNEDTRARPHEPNNQEPSGSLSTHVRDIGSGVRSTEPPHPADDSCAVEPLVSLALAKQAAENALLPPECVEIWWLEHQGRGWVDGKGQRIRDWRSSLTVFGRRWQSNDRQREAATEAKRKAAAPRALSPSDPCTVKPKVITLPPPNPDDKPLENFMQ